MRRGRLPGSYTPTEYDQALDAAQAQDEAGRLEAARPGLMIAALRVSPEGRNTVHRRVELVLAEQGRRLEDVSAEEYVELCTRAEGEVYPSLDG